MREDIASLNAMVEQNAGKTRLLRRLYREIGLAAVAAELQIDRDDLSGYQDQSEIADQHARRQADLAA